MNNPERFIRVDVIRRTGFLWLKVVHIMTMDWPLCRPLPTAEDTIILNGGLWSVNEIRYNGNNIDYPVVMYVSAM